MERGEGEGWRYCSGNYNHKVCNKANNCYCVSCARSFIFFHLVCGGGGGRNTKNDGAFCSLWRDVTCALWSFLRGWVSFFFFGTVIWAHRSTGTLSFLLAISCRGWRKKSPQRLKHLYLDVSIRMSDRPLCDFFFFVGGGFSRSSGHNRIEGREGAPAQKNPFKNN